MQIANRGIIIKEQSETNNEIQIGSSSKQRNFYIINTSNSKVKIEDIWIESNSESLLQWCNFNDEELPLIIDEKKSQKVILNFQVPLSAKPGLYNYEVRIESAKGQTFRRPQQIQLLASDKDSQSIHEPKFNIYPLTDSTHPQLLKAGEKLEVKVKIENRSRKVDRFYLSPELTPEFSTAWYTIKYPESELDIPGLVKETDGLQLNPGKEGEITLILHPPQYTLAGNYFPTIRLMSSNTEDLVLLDIFYLRILPDDSFDVRMYPPSRKIPQEKGEFAIDLTNQGNIKRELKINVKDEEGLFSYSVEPSVVEVLPGVTETLTLKAKPKKWLQWRRHLRGKGLAFNFEVDVENINKSFALPQILPQGKLVWQSRQWWVLWLLIFLAVVGIGGAAFLIWWNFLRGELPPIPPKIEKFETRKIIKDKENKIRAGNETEVSTKFQKGKDKSISLNWEISNSQKIDKVTLIRLEGNVESNRTNYLLSDRISQNKKRKNFPLDTGECTFISGENSKSSGSQKSTDKIENLLSSFANFTLPFIDKSNASTKKNDDNPSERNILNCSINSPIPQKLGKYTYKLEVFAKQNSEQASSSQITDTITIKPSTPLPLPKIIALSSSKLTYEEKDPYLLPGNLVQKSSTGSVIAPILLNWEITTPEHIQELKLIGKTPDGSVNSLEKNYKFYGGIIPKELEKYCKLDNGEKLICKDFPVRETAKAGEYIFTLTVIPKNVGTKEESENKDSVITKQTDTIKVQPLPFPEITYLSPVQTAYQEVNTAIVNHKQFTTEINKKKPPILLNWKIKNPSQVKELRVIGNNNGSLSESKAYLMNREGAPIGLQNCAVQENILDCRNIVTRAIKPGNYTFKVVLIPKQGKKTTEIIKATEAIKIESQPTPLKILSFQVNRKEAKNNPKQTFIVNKKRSDASVNLSWEVTQGKDVKVEILPVPGVVGHKGSITQYKLSKPPSSETITLKITNKAGEEKTQSVIIQTVESILPQQKKSSTTINSPGTSNTSTGSDRKNAESSNTSAPPELSPLELPPQVN